MLAIVGAGRNMTLYSFCQRVKVLMLSELTPTLTVIPGY